MRKKSPNAAPPKACSRSGKTSTPQFFDRKASGDPVISLSLTTAVPLLGERIGRLVEMLKDPEKNVRRSAADALGKIGPNAAEAVPALATALEDLDKDV